MGKKKQQKRYKGYCEHLAKGWVITDSGKIYYTQIYDYILSLTNEEFDAEFDRRLKEMGYYPPLEKVIKRPVLNKFFPEYCRPFSSEYVGQQLDNLEFKMLPLLCDRLFQEAKRDAEEPKRIVARYLASAYRHVALIETVTKDGEIYHITDPKLLPSYEKDHKLYASHENTRRCFERSIYTPQALARECNSRMVAAGFIQLMLERNKISREDLHRLADWYLKDLRLERSNTGAEAVLEALNNILGLNHKETSDFVLELYEEHSSSFDLMMAKFPGLDFIRRGTCEKYDSFDAFIEKHGETGEFFVEEANLGEKTGGTSLTKRQINKAAREEYKQKVIKDMGTMFMEAQNLGTEFHVLNFTQNELKMKAPSSNYVAVAFRRGKDWYILVDSLRKGEGAIYLWKGEYAKGLEVLKQARSFARETPGITHKNHYHSIENIVKYREIIKEAL